MKRLSLAALFLLLPPCQAGRHRAHRGGERREARAPQALLAGGAEVVQVVRDADRLGSAAAVHSSRRPYRRRPGAGGGTLPCQPPSGGVPLFDTHDSKRVVLPEK